MPKLYKKRVRVGDRIKFHDKFKAWDDYGFAMNDEGLMEPYQGCYATVTAVLDTAEGTYVYKVDTDPRWTWDRASFEVVEHA